MMKVISFLWRRRVLVAWILSLAIIIAAILSPEGRLWVRGAWRREPFYRGWPACSWAEQIKNARQARPWLVRSVYQLFAGPRAGYVPDPFEVSDPAAVPVLLSLLKHPDLRVRQFVIHALPRMTNATEIIQSYIDAAIDSKSGVSKEAASTLGVLADPKDIGVIVKGLLKSTDDQTCLSLFQEFVRNHAIAKENWKEGRETDPLADALDEAVQEKEPDLSRRARKILEMIGPDAATFARLTKILRLGDPQAREKAKREFFALPPEPSAIPGLIILLRDKDIPTRRSAADAILQLLGPWGFSRRTNPDYPAFSPVTILPALMELARTEDVESRRKAAESFARLGANSARAVPALIELLQTGDRITQAKAVQALHGARTAAEDAIPELLNVIKCEPARNATTKSPPDIRPEYHKEYVASFNKNQSEIAASDALVAIGAPAVPALAEALKRPERQVRIVAAAALRLIQPEARTAIPALISALDDDDPLVRREVVYTLGVLAWQTYGHNDKAIAALVKALGDNNREVRDWAVSALGAQELDSHSAVLALIEATRSMDPHLRDSAANALRSMCAYINQFLSTEQREFNEKNWRYRPVQTVVSTLSEIVQWDNDDPWNVVEPNGKIGPHRRKMIELLGKIGPEAKSASPALTEVSREVELYDAAMEALEKINARAPARGK
jgi:HEAT repeat protein